MAKAGLGVKSTEGPGGAERNGAYRNTVKVKRVCRRHRAPQGVTQKETPPGPCSKGGCSSYLVI